MISFGAARCLVRSEDAVEAALAVVQVSVVQLEDARLVRRGELLEPRAGVGAARPWRERLQAFVPNSPEQLCILLGSPIETY